METDYLWYALLAVGLLCFIGAGANYGSSYD